MTWNAAGDALTRDLTSIDGSEFARRVSLFLTTDRANRHLYRYETDKSLTLIPAGQRLSSS
jgi:hypothetical protein